MAITTTTGGVDATGDGAIGGPRDAAERTGRPGYTGQNNWDDPHHDPRRLGPVRSPRGAEGAPRRRDGPGWLPSRPPGAEDRRRRETGTALSERNGRLFLTELCRSPTPTSPVPA